MSDDWYAVVEEELEPMLPEETEPELLEEVEPEPPPKPKKKRKSSRVKVVELEIPPPPPPNFITPKLINPHIKSVSFAVQNDTGKVWRAKLTYVCVAWTRDGKSLLQYPKQKQRLVADVPVGGFVDRNMPIPQGEKPAEANGIGVDILLDGERWLGCQVSAFCVGF